MKSARECEKKRNDFFATQWRLLTAFDEQAEAEEKVMAAYDVDQEILNKYLAMRVRCEADIPQA